LNEMGVVGIVWEKGEEVCVKLVVDVSVYIM